MLLGKLGLGVPHHKEGLIVRLQTIDLSPGTHDPGIIGRDHRHNIDALVLQRGLLADVRREVHGLARGREGSGDADEHDFLALPFSAGVVLLRGAGEGGVVVLDGDPSFLVLVKLGKV